MSVLPFTLSCPWSSLSHSKVIPSAKVLYVHYIFFTKTIVKISDFQLSQGFSLMGCGCSSPAIKNVTGLHHCSVSKPERQPPGHRESSYRKFTQIPATKSTALFLTPGKMPSSFSRISWETAVGLLCSCRYRKGSQLHLDHALPSHPTGHYCCFLVSNIILNSLSMRDHKDDKSALP